MNKTFGKVLKERNEAIDDIVGDNLYKDIRMANEDWKDKLTKLVLSYSKTGSVYFKNVWGDKLKNEDAFKEEYVTKINKELEKYDLQLNTGNMLKNVFKGSSIHYESRYPLKPIPINGGVALLADPETKGMSFIITDDENRAKWLTGESGIKIKHSTSTEIKAGGISINLQIIVIEDEIKTLSKQETNMVEDVMDAYSDATVEPRGDVKKLLEKIYKFRDSCNCKIDLDYDEFWSINHEPIPLRVSKYIDSISKEAMDKAAATESFDFFNKVFFNMDKAFEKSVKGIMNFFQTTNIFIEDLVDFRTKTPAITTLYKLKPNFVRNMGTVKFYNVSKKKAPVILGLQISYRELKDILKNNSGYIKTLKVEMEKFDKFLLDLIETKKEKLNINVDKTTLKILTVDVKKINNDLDKVTGSKVLVDRKELGKLTKDFKDLKNVIDESLKLGLTYRMEELEDIYSINEEINTKLDILYNAVKGKKINVSKAELDTLAEYIGGVAKLTTAVAFLFYLYYQLIDMLIGAVKIVDISQEDHSAVDTVAKTIRDGWQLLTSAFK